MNLIVQRINYDDVSTQGEMTIDGAHFCYTLEPRKDQSQGKPYCVPAGIYPVVLGWSDHFQMLVPRVGNVFNFTGVEIHPGNFPNDTHGCCLVGYDESTDFVGQSRAAFDALVNKMYSTTWDQIQYIG